MIIQRGDVMYQQSEFQRIHEGYLDEVKKAAKKIRKVWATLLVLDLIITAITFGVLIFLGTDVFHWLAILIASLPIVIIALGLLISIRFVSEKPTFTNLFPKIYQRISEEQSEYLQYQAYPKDKWTFNKEGGLFVGFSQVTVKRHVRGRTKKGSSFELYQCQISSSNGKSQTVHFNGSYFVIPRRQSLYLQVRTNGSPALKGVKYSKVSDDKSMRIFIEKNKQEPSELSTYISIFQKIEMLNPMKLYMSVTHDAIHVAVEHHQKVKKTVPLTIDALNTYAERFTTELTIPSLVESQIDDLY